MYKRIRFSSSNLNSVHPKFNRSRRGSSLFLLIFGINSPPVVWWFIGWDYRYFANFLKYCYPDNSILRFVGHWFSCRRWSCSLPFWPQYRLSCHKFVSLFGVVCGVVLRVDNRKILFYVCVCTVARAFWLSDETWLLFAHVCKLWSFCWLWSCRRCCVKE